MSSAKLCMLAAACVLSGAAGSGCICTCVTAEAEVDAFESACAQHGGHVRALASTRRACVAQDAGVIATWVVDDDDAGVDGG